MPGKAKQEDGINQLFTHHSKTTLSTHHVTLSRNRLGQQMGEKELQAHIYMDVQLMNQPKASKNNNNIKNESKREREEEEEDQPKAGKMKERILFLKYATDPSAAKKAGRAWDFP